MGKYKVKIEQNLEKLWTRCDEIDVEEAAPIVAKLKDVLFDRKEFVALAAPQIRKKKRIFGIKFANGDIRAFINPMITKTEGLHFSRENSPSIPDKEFIVPRYDRIIAIYQTPTGAIEENIFEGAVAEVFQQMVQLLDGITLADLGLEIIPEWDEATDEEKTAVLNAYLEGLQKLGKQLDEEIKADETLSKTKGAIDFMTAVATGKVTLDTEEKVESDGEKVESEPNA